MQVAKSNASDSYHNRKWIGMTVIFVLAPAMQFWMQISTTLCRYELADQIEIIFG